MDIKEIRSIIDNITYKPDWSINLHDTLSGVYVQLSVKNSTDSVTKEKCDWKSGKRYLSKHMCRQEIVGVVFSVIECAEMHEMREWFRYKNASIYNPHIDPDSLVEVASKKENFNMRINAMNMSEN